MSAHALRPTHPDRSLAARSPARALRAVVLAVVLAVGLALSIALHPAAAHAATVYYVSTTGSDTATGSSSAPWRTLTKALPRLRAGDTLQVRGGTYAERIKLTVSPATSTARIAVRNYPGERPVVSGLLWLKGASYWTLDGINVTWSTANSASEHMVKMTDGVGWRLTDAELWGAHSFAAVLVAGSPSQWSLDHNYIHDTYKSNSTNQDHLVYVNAGMGSGIIERNIFARSPNGRGVKVGPPSATTTPLGNIVIRYNTFYSNLGPSNIQLSYSASKVTIYRNIFSLVASGQTNITAYNLSGTGNLAYENVGYNSSGVAPSGTKLTIGSGNFMSNPGFTSSTSDFSRVPVALAGYGRFAG